MTPADAQQFVLEEIARLAGVDPGELTPQTRLIADLGIDSAAFFALASEIEDRLEVEITGPVLDRVFLTVGDVLEALEAARGQNWK